MGVDDQRDPFRDWVFERDEEEGEYIVRLPNGITRTYDADVAAATALSLARGLIRGELRSEETAELWRRVVGEEAWQETMEAATIGEMIEGLKTTGTAA